MAENRVFEALSRKAGPNHSFPEFDLFFGGNTAILQPFSPWICIECGGIGFFFYVEDHFFCADFLQVYGFVLACCGDHCVTPPPCFRVVFWGGDVLGLADFPFCCCFFWVASLLSRWWICPKGPHCPMRRRSGGGGARAKPRYVAAHPPDGHSVVLLWFCTLVGLPLRRPKALRSFYFGQQVYI